MLNNFSLYRSGTFYLPIHKLLEIWVSSIWGLLWIMLLWIFTFKLLCRHIFSFLLNVYLDVELVCHMATLCLNFWGNVFCNGCTTLHLYQQCITVPISPYTHQQLWLQVFLTISILVDINWYLMILICIFLVDNGIEHLFMCLLANCVSSLEKCLMTRPLPIFNRVFVFILFIYQFPRYVTYQIYDLQYFILSTFSFSWWGLFF